MWQLMHDKATIYMDMSAIASSRDNRLGQPRGRTLETTCLEIGCAIAVQVPYWCLVGMDKVHSMCTAGKILLQMIPFRYRKE
jgi:hypothetical protein